MKLQLNRYNIKLKGV